MSISRRGYLALALACFGLALALLVGAWRAHAGEGARSSLLERLVGPFAGLVASAQWVRADVALRAGRFEVFCERAETALALSPADARGWTFYAHQLIFQRSSPLREPSAAARESWARAGLAILARGERECAEPAEICIDEGLVYAGWAGIPAEARPIPGTEREFLALALEAFGRARALGNSLAPSLEQSLREQLARTGR